MFAGQVANGCSKISSNSNGYGSRDGYSCGICRTHGTGPLHPRLSTDVCVPLGEFPALIEETEADYAATAEACILFTIIIILIINRILDFITISYYYHYCCYIFVAMISIRTLIVTIILMTITINRMIITTTAVIPVFTTGGLGTPFKV